MLLAFLLLYANLSETEDRTYVYIQASVFWTLYLFVITELLSLPKLLRPLPLLCAWLIADAVLIGFLIHRHHYRGLFSRPSGSIGVRIAMGLLAVLGLTVLGFSLATTPYNWDSMTYHLPRITHWVQNGSVAHYATHILRQISSPVLAEFVNLHVYVLTGKSDTLFNLLQCASYLTSACMIYRITRKLHGSQGAGLLATFLYMSMPIAVSEALTTQTDHFSALWLLYFVYLLLDFTDTQKIVFDLPSIRKVCTLSFCVSLGYLAKPSVCIAMALFVLWLLLHCILRKDSPIVLCKLLGCAFPAVVLPLLPETLRNLQTFSAISTPGVGQRQLIGTLHPQYILINFLKNFTFNMPWEYIPNSSDLLFRLVRKIAFLLQVDMNAAVIAEDGREFFLHGARDYGHDTAVNPLIMYLLVFCILLGLLTLRKYSIKKIVLGYSFIALSCFIVFCATLRWEPYVSRYMLSYLALLCPLVAIQLQNRLPRLPRYFLITAIVAFCLTDLFHQSAYHQIMMTKWGANRRPEGYFAMRHTDYEPYADLCAAIRENGYTLIGLHVGNDHYEYPLWQMLPKEVLRIEHVDVSNDSSVYTDPLFRPDCIIWLGAKPDFPYEYNGKIYETCWEYEEGYYLLCP